MFLVARAAAAAGNAPEPPCGSAPPVPAYAPANDAPTVRAWGVRELKKAAWTPPECLSWGGSTDLVVALAGSFHSGMSASQLLGRLGAISDYPSIRYWSTLAGAWRPIAARAWALSDVAAKQPRADFTAAEMSAGSPLYYAEEDSRTGIVVYRMQALSVAPERIVLAIENASPIHFYILTLFDPGALQTVMFLQRLAPTTWGLYIATRTTAGTSMFAGGHEDSYANRARAIFQYLRASQ